MFRNSGSSMNLIRFLAACTVLAATASVWAQVAPDSSSNFFEFPPAPVLRSLLTAAPLLRDSAEDASGFGIIDQVPDSGQEDPPGDDSQLTMFPHPEGGRYWLSGQANIIFQGRLPFHSPYEGPNSFRGSAEYKTSLVGTLYTAMRATRLIRYNTDLILDVESTGGRGLSQALGLAGFTNLDVVRNPNLGSTPYLARYQIHQVIGLTDRTRSQDANSFALATSVPVRRLEFRIGKMTLPDFFDFNDVGSDSHLQFMNWTSDNNGAWDYAADTRGYTVGGLAE